MTTIFLGHKKLEMDADGFSKCYLLGHLKGEVEKHDDNKQDLLSLQTVKIPVVCDQNNTVASSDNTKSLESLQMNDINEG